MVLCYHQLMVGGSKASGNGIGALNNIAEPFDDFIKQGGDCEVPDSGNFGDITRMLQDWQITYVNNYNAINGVHQQKRHKT